MSNELNTSLFEETANVIEMAPESYNQYEYGVNYDGEHYIVRPECNTPSCIAGWFIVLTDEDRNFYEDNFLPLTASVDRFDPQGDVHRRATEVSGLSEMQADILFEGWWPHMWKCPEESPLPICEHFDESDQSFDNWFVPNPDDAVAVLRRIAKHGMEDIIFNEKGE